MLNQTSSYERTVHSLESRGIMPERAPELGRMRAALEGLGLIQKIDPRKVIVVAGTNGKGSTCATLETLLEATGARTGLYTSPHLSQCTERIRVGGRDISRDAFVKAYETIAKRTQALELSHFEMLTLMAAWIFSSGEAGAPVEWLIFEVGLGGLWDATNAIPHHWCVVTSIGIDHTNLLGNTITEIARNKFGIIGRGATVIHAPLADEIRELADLTRAATGSRWVQSMTAELKVEQSIRGPQFSVSTAFGPAPIALAGLRGAQNTANALTVFRELGFNPGDYMLALGRVAWPGRMERLRDGLAPCPIYVSGDHNAQGVASLLELLPHYRREHLHVICGIGKDKDAESMLASLFTLPNTSVYLTESPFRGRKLDEYGQWLARAQAAWAKPSQSLRHAIRQARPEDMILVTGSLYLVGEIRGINIDAMQ